MKYSLLRKSWRQKGRSRAQKEEARSGIKKRSCFARGLNFVQRYVGLFKQGRVGVAVFARERNTDAHAKLQVFVVVAEINIFELVADFLRLGFYLFDILEIFYEQHKFVAAHAPYNVAFAEYRVNFWDISISTLSPMACPRMSLKFLKLSISSTIKACRRLSEGVSCLRKFSMKYLVVEMLYRLVKGSRLLASISASISCFLSVISASLPIITLEEPSIIM